MGRIRYLLITIIVIFNLVILVSCDNTLLDVIEDKIAAANSIIVNFQYVGSYELSEDYPINLKFLPNPFTGDFDDLNATYNVKITSDGLIPVSFTELPPSETGKYVMMILHDLNNNGIDNEDNEAEYIDNDAGNFTYDISPEIISITADPFSATYSDKVSMTVGNLYSISYENEAVWAADVYEPDDTFLTASDDLSLGDSSSHNLEWGDSDYIKLSPASDGTYKVTVSMYNSTIPIDISLMVDAGGFWHVFSLYNKTKNDFPVEIENFLDIEPGSRQYYLHIRSSNIKSNAMGEYEVSFTIP